SPRNSVGVVSLAATPVVVTVSANAASSDAVDGSTTAVDLAPSPDPPARGLAASPAPPTRGPAADSSPPARGLAASPAPPARGLAADPSPPARGLAADPSPPARGLAADPSPPARGLAASPDPVTHAKPITPARTTVVFTTSPLLLDRAHRVAYVEDGRVIAAGAHRDLLSSEPRYAAVVTRGEDE